MKRIINYFFATILAISCTNQHPHNYSKTANKDLQEGTQSIKALQDSFHRTGDFRYMEKFIVKIDDLIKKYPDQNGFKQVRKMMIDMWGDSLHLKPVK